MEKRRLHCGLFNLKNLRTYPKNIQEYSDIKFNFRKISLANIVYFNGGGSEI
jgi:hypothetical protein